MNITASGDTGILIVILVIVAIIALLVWTITMLRR